MNSIACPPPVMVVGMHRSGTSLTTNLLRQCGLWIGPEEELHGAAASNPDGHWENIAVTGVNDFMLSELGGGWDAVPEFPADWLSRFPAQTQQARKIHASLAQPMPWGWKDPRASLLMPFWLSLEPRAKVVVCLRNPLEVADSLRNRGMMSYSLGLRLWRDYYQRLRTDVPSSRRLIVPYEDYFTQPLQMIKRLVEFCGLNISGAEVVRIAATIKASLRHTKFNVEDLTKTVVSPDIIALYQQVRAEAGFPGVPIGVPSPIIRTQRQIDLQALDREIFLRRWRSFVQSHTPIGARVTIVSKGDSELLRLHRRVGSHFPCDAEARYLGYYPATDGEAVAHLNASQAAGAQFFAIPVSALWWLDFYPEWGQYLDKHCTSRATDRQIGTIFELAVPAGPHRREITNCEMPGLEPVAER